MRQILLSFGNPLQTGEGYATFEDEVMYLDALVIAQAVHNNGGIVMMQVQKMVKKATLRPKSVRIPGY